MTIDLSGPIELLNRWGTVHWEFARVMLVQLTILVLVLVGLDLVLLRYQRAAVRYAIWTLVLVKLCLPVTMASPLSVAYWLPTEAPGASEHAARDVRPTRAASPRPAVAIPHPSPPETGPVPVGGQVHQAVDSPLAGNAVPSDRPIRSSQPVPPTDPAAAEKSKRLDWRAYLLLAWLSVLALLSAYVLRRALIVRGIVARSIPASPELQGPLRDCLKLVGVSGKRVRLRLTDELGSPAVCGWRSATILLPRQLLGDLDLNQIRQVIVHELVHWRRWDLQLNGLQSVLQVIYFYNPMVWLANAVLRRLREQAVDEAALVLLKVPPPEYSSTLLDVAASACHPVRRRLRLVGVVESNGALAGRVRRMLTRPVPQRTQLGASGLAAILLVALTLLPMAGPRRSVATAEDTLPASTGESADAVAPRPVPRGVQQEPVDQAGQSEPQLRVRSLEPDPNISGQGANAGDALGVQRQPNGVAALEPIVQLTHGHTVLCIRFSPSGKKFVTGSDSPLTLWDARDFRIIRHLPAGRAIITDAAFSPDESRIAASDIETAFVWDTSNGRRLLEASSPTWGLRSVAFAEDRLLAARRESVWDVATNELICKLDVPDETRMGTVLSPDGRLVLHGTNSATVKLVDLTSGETRDFRVSAKPIDPQDGFRRRLIEQGRGAARPRKVSVRGFSSDSRLIMASADGVADVWDIATSSKIATLPDFRGQFNFMANVSFSPTGDQLLVCDGHLGRHQRWDLKQAKVLPGFGRAVVGAFSPDGKHVVIGNYHKSVSLWNEARHEKLATMLANSGATYVSATRSGQRLAIAGWEQPLMLWDLASGKLVQRIHEPSRGFGRPALGPDGNVAAGQLTRNTVAVWDTVSGERLRTFDHRVKERSLWPVAFSRDAELLLVAADDQAMLFNIVSGARLLVLDEHIGNVSGAAFTPDGGRLIVAAGANAAKDGEVKVFDVGTGEVLQRIAFNGEPVSAIDLDRKGQLLVVGSGTPRRPRLAGWISTWDLKTGKQLNRWKAHDDPFLTLAMSPDGMQILSGSGDMQACLWTVGGELVKKLPHSNKVTSVVFLGKQCVATGSSGGVARLWNLASGEDAACIYNMDQGKHWLAVANNGVFDGSQEAAQFMDWRRGAELVPKESLPQLRAKMRRPDEIAQVIQAVHAGSSPGSQ